MKSPPNKPSASPAAPRTPVRESLTGGSILLASVQDGLAAMKPKDKDCLDQAIRSDFADNLDLDTALKEDHANDHRWDYLLGHEPTTWVVGVEIHSANTKEVSEVIKKKRAALLQLRGHVKAGRTPCRWFWVASGANHIHGLDKERRKLESEGIEQVKQVMKKPLS